MKNFIKNNIVLVLGVTLPILLSAVFFVANELPKYFVEDPKYSLLFAGNGYYTGAPYNFKVEQGKLKLFFTPPQNMSANYKPPVPELYKFDPVKNTVNTIEFSTASFAQDAPSEIVLPETESLTVDTSPTAPDGYTFTSSRHYDTDIAMGIFFGRGYSSMTVIEKNRRKVKLPNSAQYPYYYDIHFIGWITKEEGK